MPAAIGFRGVGHIGVLTLLVSVVQSGKAQSFNIYSVKDREERMKMILSRKLIMIYPEGSYRVLHLSRSKVTN